METSDDPGASSDAAISLSLEAATGSARVDDAEAPAPNLSRVDAAEDAAAAANLRRWFLFGQLALFAGAGLLLALIAGTFEPDDRLVPIGFVVVETALAVTALALVGGARARHVLGAVAEEERTAADLGASGLSLGDTFAFLQTRRQELTASFLEASSGWSNLLITAGMVGTAGYLVTHAGRFVVGDQADLSNSLAKLLALAPKSFAATGLALFGAIVVQLCASVVTRRIEKGKLEHPEVVAAWNRVRTTAKSEEQAALVQAVGAVLDERVVARLEELPNRLDRVAASSEQAVRVMADTVLSLSDSLGQVGGRLEVIGDGMASYGRNVEAVLAAFQALSTQSQRVVDQLGQTQETVSRAATEAIERMQQVISKYQEQMFDEVSRKTPEFIGDALSGATEEFTRQIKAHGTAIESTIATIANASFGEATRQFERGVTATSEAVRGLADQIGRADEVISRLGNLLDVAGRQWDPQVELARGALEKLTSSFSRLGEAGAPAPGAVASLCDALERSSRELMERHELVLRQANALGQIDGLLARSGGRS